MRQVLTSENHSMYIQMTSLAQLTKQSYSSSNTVVRWLNRRQTHGREQFYSILGSLSKPRRRRQRERYKTKGLMSRTMPVHVRLEPLYIS